MRKYSWLLLLIGYNALAQSALDDFFYSENKIYVVVAVLLVIFIGITSYLVRIDRKVKRLEDEQNDK